MKSHRIDERKDNIRKIKEVIKNTQDNIEFADEMIKAVTDPKHKQSLKVQNEHRNDSIDTLQDELKEKIGNEKKNN